MSFIAQRYSEWPSRVLERFPEPDDTDDHHWDEDDLKERHRYTNNRYLEAKFLKIHGGTVRGLLYPSPHRGHNKMTAEEKSCNLAATDILKLPIVKTYDEGDVFLVKETITCCVCYKAMKLHFFYEVDENSFISGKNKVA